MWKFRWERHEYDILQKKHLKVNEGEFSAGSLQSAKSKATRKSGMIHGTWSMLPSAPMSKQLRGRVYVKQPMSRPGYENLNPKLYLYVLGVSDAT